jgi:hypothetical protein
VREEAEVVEVAREGDGSCCCGGRGGCGQESVVGGECLAGHREGK